MAAKKTVENTTIQAAAKVFAKFAQENVTTTISFDESYEHGIQIEWQTCISLEVRPDDVLPTLNALALLDRLGAKPL